jgi:hypothetical protein
MRAPVRPRLCSRRENFHVASFIQLRTVRESKEQDKCSGEHQRGHPD